VDAHRSSIAKHELSIAGYELFRATHELSKAYLQFIVQTPRNPI